MTWKEAQQEAEAKLELLEREMKGAGRMLADAGAVALPRYDGAQAYRAVKPDDPWSFEDARLVNRAMARLLKRRGLSVRWRVIRAEEFRQWLASTGRANSPLTRAQYVALGWPEP